MKVGSRWFLAKSDCYRPPIDTPRPPLRQPRLRTGLRTWFLKPGGPPLASALNSAASSASPPLFSPTAMRAAPHFRPKAGLDLAKAASRSSAAAALRHGKGSKRSRSMESKTPFGRLPPNRFCTQLGSAFVRPGQSYGWLCPVCAATRPATHSIHPAKCPYRANSGRCAPSRVRWILFLARPWVSAGRGAVAPLGDMLVPINFIDRTISARSAFRPGGAVASGHSPILSVPHSVPMLGRCGPRA